MKIIHLLLAAVLLAAAPLASFAAQGGHSVRAILLIASRTPGQTDARLAPYEPVLRSNLRFESYRFVGESSASVSAGGTATLSLPGGNRVELESDAAGNVKVRRGGASIPVSRPVVLLGGPAGGNGDVYGIIVMAQ
ncbi:MAG TPA: hypothetical protein VHD62_01115 [Opitutaceae bacterium]|nr:hypothetical protein [Opitutaceae bacterium]